MLIKQSYDVHVKTMVRWLYFDSLHSYCYFLRHQKDIVPQKTAKQKT